MNWQEVCDDPILRDLPYKIELVEVMSPSNSLPEMEEKRELYFARGAQEVWLCDEQGALSFYDCTGQIPASRLFPNLSRIESDYLH